MYSMYFCLFSVYVCMTVGLFCMYIQKNKVLKKKEEKEKKECNKKNTVFPSVIKPLLYISIYI